MELILAFFSQLFLTDGLDYLHPVYIYAQITLYSSLCLWLRCGKDSCNCIRIFSNRMNVCSSSAYIYGHYIADAVIEQLGTLHYSPRRRDNRSAYHVSDMLHSRCVCDMILKSILNYLAARFNIESIYLWINIVYQVKVLSAFFVKDKLHFVLIFNISCVNHGCFQAHRSYHFSIVYSRISFAIVYTTRDKYQVRVDFLDSGDIASSQFAYGNVVNNSTCTESCFLSSLSRHVVDQTMNCHFKSTGCR